MLLARSRIYGPFRIVGASLTGVAAAAWFVERANPLAPLAEGIASPALWLPAGLVVLTVTVSRSSVSIANAMVDVCG